MQTTNRGEQYIVFLTRNVVKDSTGFYHIYLDDLPQKMTRNGPSSQVDTITMGPDENGRSFRQTLTFDASGNVAAISAWTLVAGGA